MKSEKIVTKKHSYSVNFSGNRVDSYRCKNEMSTVVRVYDGGYIGIAATDGEDDGTLYERAQAKLSQGIAYPDDLASGGQRSVDATAEIVANDKLVATVKSLIKRLAEEYPDFIFSYKVNKEVVDIDYTNSENTHYNYKSSSMDVFPQIKEKKSANIMDLYYGVTVKHYDEDKIVRDIGVLLNVYDNKVDFPEEEVPVVLPISYCLSYLLSELTAEKYMTGASLLKGKLGEKVFSEKLSLFCDRSEQNIYNTPFFDAEGTVNDGDKFYYIDKGVFNGVAAYKRTAKMFSLPLTGAAFSEFDEVPHVGFTGINVETCGKKLSEIAKGKSIYIAVSSGGDMSPDGDVALPVMVAYLCEDGKPVGTLPTFGAAGNIFNLLGDDLIGVADNDMFEDSDEKVIVAKFKLNK